MTATVYYIICGVLTVGVLTGIALMSKVRLAAWGNLLSAVCMALAIGVTLFRYGILSDILLWVCIAVGLVLGLIWAARIKMIEMPEIVAVYNGFGGASSALVAMITLLEDDGMGLFARVTAALALAVGAITLIGSLIAAGKLHKVLPQKPVILKGHPFLTGAALLLTAAAVVLIAGNWLPAYVSILLCTVFSLLFGVAFAIRVGGADMPITISLLNSLSGVAGAIAGMAIGDPLLVAVGGIVGASGLLLTQIMCKAMNRHLFDILLGKTASAGRRNKKEAPSTAEQPVEPEKPVQAEQPALRQAASPETEAAYLLREAKRVILIPGYGMALAQAQHQVKQLADALEANGAQVDFAIHPVAGRMPGHMNVLLCEADVPYEKLHEMEEINPQFPACDVAVVIGANDVINPAARNAEGTPIYGMPVLDVDRAKHVIVCNYDLKPGYAGVENPLYTKQEGVTLLLGDAAKTLQGLLGALSTTQAPDTPQECPDDTVQESAPRQSPADILRAAKRVILIPGYGMALAQAQHQVKQLADALEANGAQVDFAIHPVAGRMPGHMNVLLCEADVPYEKLHEMEEINPQFPACDVAVVIGANDVINPAARDAEGTPIYGMPVLDVDRAKHVIVCNYDLKPGYAGVENPLYTKQEGVTLLLGDAAKTLRGLLDSLSLASVS